MPKRTLALILGLIILTVVLLYAATQTSTPPVQKQQQQPTSPLPTPTPTPPAYTTLDLSPNPLTITQSGSGTIQVLIDTDKNTATGVQLELSYDPKAITNVKITPGTFFKNPLIIPQWNKIDTQTGRISHAQVLNPNQDGVKGKGVVATISFTKRSGTQLTQTTIDFLPKTAVTQVGINPSVLKTSIGTTIYLGPTNITSQTSQTPPTTPPAQ